MSTPRQDAASGEAARSGTTVDDGKRKAMEQLHTYGYLE
jgi:hypothetical protein